MLLWIISNLDVLLSHAAFAVYHFTGFPSNNFSVTAWIRPQGGFPRSIFTYATPGQSNTFSLGLDASARLYIGLWNSTFSLSSNTASDGRW